MISGIFSCAKKGTDSGGGAATGHDCTGHGAGPFAACNNVWGDPLANLRQLVQVLEHGGDSEDLVLRRLREQGLEDCGSGEVITVSLPVSKATIASRLSLTPEYFSRVLHELEAAWNNTTKHLQTESIVSAGEMRAAELHARMLPDREAVEVSFLHGEDVNRHRLGAVKRRLARREPLGQPERDHRARNGPRQHRQRCGGKAQPGQQHHWEDGHQHR